MLRLYLRFYLALVVSLVLFVLATAALWHFTGGSSEQAGVTLGRFIQNILPPATAPASEQQEALRRLAVGLKGDVTLFDRDEQPVASIGQPLPSPGAHRHNTMGLAHWEGAPISYVHLADGRWIVASVPMAYGHARTVFHLMLVLLALAIGVAAYPLVRQISGRLERLQRGVESLESPSRAATKLPDWPRVSIERPVISSNSSRVTSPCWRTHRMSYEPPWPGSDWPWSS
jgi:two-component system, OmpR family, sensor histidine kinase RstB